MIACPRCNSATEVVETRGERRRRVCPKCLARFTTYEGVPSNPVSKWKTKRRTISFAPDIFAAAKEVAEAEGVSLSEWTTRLVRAAIPGLAVVAPVVEERPTFSRADLDAMAEARRRKKEAA